MKPKFKPGDVLQHSFTEEVLGKIIKVSTRFLIRQDDIVGDKVVSNKYVIYDHCIRSHTDTSQLTIGDKIIYEGVCPSSFSHTQLMDGIISKVYHDYLIAETDIDTKYYSEDDVELSSKSKILL